MPLIRQAIMGYGRALHVYQNESEMLKGKINMKVY